MRSFAARPFNASEALDVGFAATSRLDATRATPNALHQTLRLPTYPPIDMSCLSAEELGARLFSEAHNDRIPGGGGVDAFPSSKADDVHEELARRLVSSVSALPPTHDPSNRLNRLSARSGSSRKRCYSSLSTRRRRSHGSGSGLKEASPERRNNAKQRETGSELEKIARDVSAGAVQDTLKMISKQFGLESSMGSADRTASAGDHASMFNDQRHSSSEAAAILRGTLRRLRRTDRKLHRQAAPHFRAWWRVFRGASSPLNDSTRR